ncbi:MAG: 4Fe-4S binding protein [Rikenellaceae bacterium]
MSKQQRDNIAAKSIKSGFLIGDSCTQCGACAANCPKRCIHSGNPYVIDQQRCLHCGLCVESCPVRAIKPI